MKILAMGASTSSSSINRVFANYVANLIPNALVTDLDLRQYSLPLYSVDEEEKNGIPLQVSHFINQIETHDKIVISLAEHNASFAVGYKNITDWASRVKYKLWSEKPLLLLSTSPGARGGASVMAAASGAYPYLGANVKACFSLPSFMENFQNGKVVNPDYKAKIDSAIRCFLT